MLTVRTLADFREILRDFEPVHGRWHDLVVIAVDRKDVGAMRDLFDEAPAVVTEHARFIDLWRTLALAEHENDTTEVIPPAHT